MKPMFCLLISIVAFSTIINFLGGCQRIDTVLAPPIPIPPPQTLLSNGNSGTWFGNAVTLSTFGGCAASSSVTALADTLSGNPNTLLLNTPAVCGVFEFDSPVTVDPTPYYSKGHLQFDILLGSAASNYSSINVQFFYSNGADASYNLPANLINSLSSTVFTRVSIPLIAFPGYNLITNVDTPFYMLWQTSTSSSSIVLDNVQWTAN